MQGVGVTKPAPSELLIYFESDASSERQKIDELNFSKMWREKGLKESKIDKIMQKSQALIL